MVNLQQTATLSLVKIPVLQYLQKIALNKVLKYNNYSSKLFYKSASRKC